MAIATSTPIDQVRLQELTETEEVTLNERTRQSAAMYDRARHSMVGGVASSYQNRAPWPIYLAEGRGSRVWDVDGNELIDFHNGSGSMVQGHAHPAIVRAVQERVAKGTHFAAPVEDGIAISANQDTELVDLAWLYMTNRGTFMTPGREEEWTLSVAHTLEDRDRYIAAFEATARDLVA